MAHKTVNTQTEEAENAESSLSRVRRWLVSFPRAVPLVIFLSISATTALSVFAIESNARVRERAELNETAQLIASALERRGQNFATYLRAGAALFSTTEAVERRAFGQFVSELRLDLEYRGSEGLGWVTIVEAAEAADFVNLQRRAQPDFPDIRPPLASGSSVSAPVTYFFPDTTRNRRALGFDMQSDPVRAAAMGEALRTAQPTASARTAITQSEPENTAGFVIFMPVFRQIEGGRSVDRALAGFVYSPFNAKRFLDAAMENASPSGVGVLLYDGAVEADTLLAAHALTQTKGGAVEHPLVVANRPLTLVVEAQESRTLAPLSMVSLVFGLTLASLLMLLARLLTQQAFEDQSRLAFFEEQHSIRNSLTRELNHRVKNTLANVLSIMALTRRRAHGLNDFADSLEGRIRSLSATHDLLTGTDWGTTPLRSVVEAELQHFRATHEHIINVDGPPVELAPNDALSFGLAIHELATNAAKYGALSVPDGRVSIYWKLIEERTVEVEWCEREGPEVKAERGRGFGTELIEKIVSHELKHPVQLTFAREGVRCVMRVPVRRRRDFQIRQ